MGLDQIIRDPTCRKELKKSFFDYMADARVTLRDLEGRMDEVFDRLPPEVRNGRTDHIPRYFRVATGISGGSLRPLSVRSPRTRGRHPATPTNCTRHCSAWCWCRGRW